MIFKFMLLIIYSINGRPIKIIMLYYLGNLDDYDEIARRFCPSCR